MGSGGFSAIFHKTDTLGDLSFAFQHTKALLKESL